MTIVILAGQSNALGFGNSGPAPYTPTPRVEIWTDTNHNGVWDYGDNFNMMVPGVNTGTPANPNVWGPEVEIAKAWLAANPSGTLYIGKVAHGSTGLAADPTQLDWSPHSTGEMFDQATFVARSMQANLGVSEIDAAFFMQGETDATDPAKAAAYGSNLTEFIADARGAWNVEDFVVGRITDTAGAYNEAVRDAQWLDDQTDPDMVSFKTIGFGMQADQLHYDAAGQIALGQGFYDGWMG